MAKTKRTYIIHGVKTPYGSCEDAPRCGACDTGMVCNINDAGHFCGWHECPAYDGSAMMAWRSAMNAGKR